MPIGPFAVVGLFLGGASIIQGQRAASATRRANAVQQRIADVKAQRERTRLIGEARRKRAELAQQAELTGVGGSSGAIAGQSGVTSQVGSGISFLDTVQQLGQESNIFLNKASSAQSTASIFSVGSGLAFNQAKLKGEID